MRFPQAVMKNRPTTRPHVMLARFHRWNELKKYSLQQQNFVWLIFLYFPCYGTMGLPSPFVFYAFVDIDIRSFNTDHDLSLLIRFSVIEVKQKEVATVTSVSYSCKTSKTSKMNSNIILVKKTYA